MAEIVRSFKAKITVDTNKRTSVEECDTPYQVAVSVFAMLSPEQRMEVFADYCKHCGSDDPRCQCWNDE